MRYALLATIMFFAANATNAMNNNNDNNLSNSSLTHKLFLSKTISETYNAPKEITQFIQWLFAMPSPNHLRQWKDFNIPLHFNLTLSEQNIKTIKAFFDSPRSHIASFRPQITYILTPELYTNFITLPKEFRQYLTILPQSKQTQKYTNSPINTGEIVLVNGQRKPIIPEDNTHAFQNTYTSTISSFKSLMLENIRNY
jgi:hypothetical protein